MCTSSGRSHALSRPRMLCQTFAHPIQTLRTSRVCLRRVAVLACVTVSWVWLAGGGMHNGFFGWWPHWQA